MSTAGNEVQSRQWFVIRLVRLESGYAISGVRVERVHLLGQDDVIADPHVIVAKVFGSLGHGAKLLRTGHLASAG